MKYRDSVAAGLRLILLGAFGGAALLMSNTTLDVKPATPLPDLAADEAAALIAEHDCSVTGYTDIIPGHAVVDTGTGVRYAKSDPAFEIAFGPDDVMGSGDEREGTVYAFCV